LNYRPIPSPVRLVHYANCNIKDVSLLEALKSPLFMEYRKNQPFNGNHLRPCPLMDNPEKLRGMVRRSGAYSADLASPEDVGDLTGKCRDCAASWAEHAERLWNEQVAEKDSFLPSESLLL
jgi:hypothetical protein